MCIRIHLSSVLAPCQAVSGLSHVMDDRDVDSNIGRLSFRVIISISAVFLIPKHTSVARKQLSIPLNRILQGVIHVMHVRLLVES